MPTNTLTPNKQQIVELRNLFVQRYKTNPPDVPFHAIDLKRIHDNDIWLIKFLETYDLDVNISLEKLWFTCTWRQQYKSYDLWEHDLRQDYLNDGFIFSHNYDVDGKILLIFHTKNHVKGSKNLDDICRIVVYYIERLHRQTNMDKITLFFDMSGTGLTNMDIDLIRCIIDIFKLYYPDALNYILVFEMAWILNAAFKVIKALLPEKAQAILKVIKKKDINIYVDKDNCLTSWGGNDDYTFHFVPENRISDYKQEQTLQVEQEHDHFNDELSNNYNDNNNNNNDNIFNSLNKKMVHFENESSKRETLIDTNVNDTKSISKTKEERSMLRLVPNDYIEFTRGQTSESAVHLENVFKFPVTFKIQTTSPEKFRVRPRCGVILPSESAVINILIKADQSLSENGRDKFLIMCLPANDITSMQEVNEFWRQQNNNAPNIEQHRLCCIYKDGPKTDVPNAMPYATAKQALTQPQISTNNMKIIADLERRLQFTQRLQMITITAVTVLFGLLIYLILLHFYDDMESCNNVE